MEKLILNSTKQFNNVNLTFEIINNKLRMKEEKLEIQTDEVKILLFDNFSLLTFKGKYPDNWDVLQKYDDYIYNPIYKSQIKITFPENSNDLIQMISSAPITLKFIDQNTYYVVLSCYDYICINKGDSVFENIAYNEVCSDVTNNDAISLDYIEECYQTMIKSSWFNDFDYKHKKTKTEKEITKDLIKKEEKKKKKGKNVVAQSTEDDNNFVNLKSLKAITGSSNPMQELNKIIGLNNIKEDIKKINAKLEYDEKRKKRGIENNNATSYHMVFMGNPGTGKTTVARIMTGILYNMKCIKENKCIEISGLDLQGGYVGQTAIITQNIVNLAKGGVLFVDEAYALCKSSSYGKEAISVLLKEIEDNRGDIVVIFAGYEKDMNEFLDINPGFRSRINKYFNFEDYTAEELMQILMIFLRKRHLKADKESLKKIMNLFIQAKKHSNFSNGRFVRNLTEKIEEEHISNVNGITDFVRLDTITSEDISHGLIEYMLDTI